MKDYSLTIDRGNSAIKAALWTSAGTIETRCAGGEAMDAGALARSLAGDDKHISAIAYCTVVGAMRDRDLASLGSTGAPVVEVKANVELPLRIGYRTPDTLGPDRIAAAAGALLHAGGKPVLVVDMGTAITYDFVDGQGCFAGGNIAPGIDLRLRALNGGTAALPATDPRGAAPMWGTTTAEALRSGALRGVAAELAYYRRAAGPEASAVLTGGGVRLLREAGLLDDDYIYDPDLVHRGLYSILKRNGY